MLAANSSNYSVTGVTCGVSGSLFLAANATTILYQLTFDGCLLKQSRDRMNVTDVNVVEVADDIDWSISKAELYQY